MLDMKVFNSLKCQNLPSVIKNMLIINLHHKNYGFKIALSLFIRINLVYVNINIGIFYF